ncbi:hypothetical protein ROS1_55520 [Roseibium sp. ROS1]
MGAAARLGLVAHRLYEAQCHLAAEQRAGEFLRNVQRLHRRDQRALPQKMLPRLHRGKAEKPVFGERFVRPGTA